jgi:hypothetical protein
VFVALVACAGIALVRRLGASLPVATTKYLAEVTQGGPTSSVTPTAAATTATTSVAATTTVPGAVGRPPTQYELEHVRVSSGLGEIVYALANADPTHPVGFTDDPQAAVAVGLLSSEEATSLDREAFVTRGQYALWLWRAYRTYLAKGEARLSSGPMLADLELLPAEVREAVLELASYGIVRGTPDGLFHGSDDLTVLQKRTLINRLEEILPLRLLPIERVVWALEMARVWVAQRLLEEATAKGLRVESFSMEDAGPYGGGSVQPLSLPRGFRLLKLVLTSPRGEAPAKAFIAGLRSLVYGFNQHQGTLIGIYQVHAVDSEENPLFDYQNDLENHVERWG